MSQENDLQTPLPLSHRLTACLRARHTYLLIYESYAKGRPKEDFRELLVTLIDDTHDSIASISAAMRRLGLRPTAAGINETVLGQGMSRRGTLSKLNFVLVGANRTLEWYASQRSAEDEPEVEALWQELIAREEEHRQMVIAFLDRAQLARSSRAGDDDEG